MSDSPWLKDQIKTSKNLCEIALILIEVGRRELLPTVLELLFYYTQTIMDESCIEEEK